jgi:hypothetical protein
LHRLWRYQRFVALNHGDRVYPFASIGLKQRNDLSDTTGCSIMVCGRHYNLAIDAPDIIGNCHVAGCYERVLSAYRQTGAMKAMAHHRHPQYGCQGLVREPG